MRNDIIVAKLEEIEENLELISNHLPTDLEEFLNLGLIKDGIYKRLEYSIELVLDILAIINADLKLGIPDGETSVIDNIEKNKILDKEITEKIRKMKSFRNILVHRYGKINDELVFELLKEDLEDFFIICDSIVEFLRKKEKEV
ncbi:MAG: type VII toxin-antitoxin system HepT family RNase toxin [Candidatus Heimdallarchaeaceae archaeon]